MDTKMEYQPQEGFPLMQGGQQMYNPPAGYPPGPPQTVPFPPGPILSQPTMGGGAPNSNFGNAPQNIPNCPPGLEYLAAIDQLIVQQKVEILEAFTGFESKNKYVVCNSMGQKIFFAGEESDCCTRNCCGPIRPFEMKIVDNFGREVVHLNRPLACQECCFPCCLQTMEVTSPPGTIIGIIEQQWSILYPKYVVKAPSGDILLRVEGPCCTCKCCTDVNFKVFSADGTTEIGRISKHWSGLAKEVFTDADNFGITFPMDLDVRMKATLLGLLFLIDFMYFESDD